MSSRTKQPLTFGSLFAGIGGLDLGLERAGMQCRWQVEINPYATRVLAKHWPNVGRWPDVTTFPPDSSQCMGNESASDATISTAQPRQFRRSGGSHAVWRVDVVAGGFPCQDISYAGQGAGLDGARSRLFFEALRVVRQLRPSYVLLENVAALLARGLDRVLGELAAVGYDAEWHCIPAAAVGAPHIRDRVFILAYANEPRPQKRPIINSDARAQLAAFERGHREPIGQWCVEPAVGRVAHGVPARVDRLRGLGNAVVPQVAEWIGRRIIEADQAGIAALAELPSRKPATPLEK